jgi:hypothetical protein
MASIVTTTTIPATTAGTNITVQKAGVEVSFNALIKGITTELASVDSFTLGGKALPRASVLGTLQSRVDASEQTKAARTAFHLAVESERAVALDADALRAELKVWLQAHFGSKSTKLQEFGFVPRKRGKATAAVKAAGAAKAKATKQARLIVGKNQRKLIKAPALPQPAPQPATASATQPLPQPAQTAPAAPAPAPAPGPAKNGTPTVAQ